MEQAQPIRVLVADHSPLFRLGIRKLLEQQENVELVSEVGTGEEATQKTRELHPNVVIMDIRMPEMGGIEATRRIKQEMPEVGIVMVSTVDDESDIFEAIRAGANGYIMKDEDPAMLVRAVRSAAQGMAYLPPEIAKRVLERVAGSMSPSSRGSPSGSAGLTERELSVLRLLAQGRRNREIAQALNISERTVGNHIVNIYNKLHINDRAQAIIYAVQKGIIKI